MAALLTGALVAIVLTLMAPWLAAHVLNDGTLTTALRLSALALFFTAWASAQAGGLGGIEAFSTSARLSIIGGVITFVCSFVGIWYWASSAPLAHCPSPVPANA